MNTKLNNKIGKSKFILALIFFAAISAKSQTFEKDDLAHLEAGALIHSTTYFAVSAFKMDNKWKYIAPLITVNAAGVTKEYFDSKKPHNSFDMKDIMLNNVGMLISMGLIEGLRAIGVPDNIAVGSVMAVSTVSLGLTVNF